MGVIWSRLLTSGDGDDYERILSDLTTRIQQLDVQLDDTRAAERRSIFWLIGYGCLLYALSILYIFFYPRGPAAVPYRRLLDAAVLLGSPLILFGVRKCVSFVYARRVSSLETSLRSLRAKQKLKLEELKKKTAYYRTKGLIELYEREGSVTLCEEAGVGALRRPSQSNGSPPSVGQAGGSWPSLEVAPAANSINKSASALTPSPPPTAPVRTLPAAVSATWVDRLTDALLGDDRNSRYALICEKCYTHNGLARPDDYASTQYICPNCGHFNGPRAAIAASIDSLTSEAGKSDNVSCDALEDNLEMAELSKPGPLPVENSTPKQDHNGRKARRRGRKKQEADSD